MPRPVHVLQRLLALVALAVAFVVPLSSASPASAYTACTSSFATASLDYDQGISGDQVALRGYGGYFCTGTITWTAELHRMISGVGGCSGTSSTGCSQLVNRWSGSRSAATGVQWSNRQGGAPAYYRLIFRVTGNYSTEGDRVTRTADTGWLYCGEYSCRR